MNRAFRILVAGVFINLCIGVLYAWTVISKALVSEMGWSTTSAGLPYTVGVVAFSVVMLVITGVMALMIKPVNAADVAGHKLGDNPATVS